MINYNNFEGQIKNILEGVPTGSFVSVTPSSDIVLSASQRGTFNKTADGLILNGCIIDTSVDNGTTGGLYDTGIINNKLMIDNSTTRILQNSYGLSTNDFTKEKYCNFKATNSGIIDDISITTTAPHRPLFIDKCSSQFFTETGLIQDFTYACATNNLTGTITYPNLTHEYKQNNIGFETVLLENDWTILKTSMDSATIGTTHAGEKELVSYISNEPNLYNTATIITSDKSLINKCINAGIGILHHWEFVIFMIIKKIIDWFKAEEIYKKFDNYKIFYRKGLVYASLREYYDANKTKIDKHLKKLINKKI